MIGSIISYNNLIFSYYLNNICFKTYDRVLITPVYAWYLIHGIKFSFFVSDMVFTFS